MQRTDCPITVALYCRVSTDEQAQQGFSIASQQQRLAAYCVSQGWGNYAYYIDDGYSGTTLDRPALRRLLQDVAARRVQAVVVYRLDRLGRKQKDVLHLLEDVFEAQGVAFQSATEPFDTATPLGKAMLGILAVFAQLERDTIVERTTMGRRQRIQDGLWHGGRVPFGYRWDRARQSLTIHRAEAAVVRSVFRRFLSGESLSSLADWANAQSDARNFTHTAIRQMLTRPIYAGYLNRAGERVHGQHQPIVDLATLSAAELALRERQRTYTRGGSYLLSGLVVCGVCGGSVIHIRRKSSSGTRGGSDTESSDTDRDVRDAGSLSYDYYGCKRQHQRRRGQGNTCTLGYYRQSELDAAVVQAVLGIALDGELVHQMSADELTDATSARAEETRRVEQLREEQAQIQARLTQWYEAFESGQVTMNEVRDRIAELKQAQTDVVARIAASETELFGHGAPSHGGQGPQYHANLPLVRPEHLIADTWPMLTDAERQAVVRAAVRRVVLTPGRKPPVIEWNI